MGRRPDIAPNASPITRMLTQKKAKPSTVFEPEPQEDLGAFVEEVQNALGSFKVSKTPLLNALLKMKPERVKTIPYRYSEIKRPRVFSFDRMSPPLLAALSSDLEGCALLEFPVGTRNPFSVGDLLEINERLVGRTIAVVRTTDSLRNSVVLKLVSASPALAERYNAITVIGSALASA